MLPRFVIWMFLVGLMVLGASAASGQTTSTGSGQAASTGSGHAYPNRPIRIVTSEAGGGKDFEARLIAQGISGPLGQQVIVENRSSSILGELVAKASPDGYTLLVYGSAIWIGPLLQKTLYDPVRDFAPITLANTAPNVVVVTPSLPVKSVKELIALAKARPGELNYASAATGSASHLAGELFKAMAGVNIVRISYKGLALTFNDLIGGQVQLMIPSAATVVPQIKSGKLRALAVSSAGPSALFPDLPTVAASGLPGYESASQTAVFAPARTPKAFVNRLNQEIVRVLNQPAVKEKLFNAGIETVGSSAEQLSATVGSEMAKWSKVIKNAGMHEQ